MTTALSAPPQAAIPQANPGTDWKQQLADRLDAYRAKHPEHKPSSSLPSNNATDTRASKIARAVASRYAAAPTYKDLLQKELFQAAERDASDRPAVPGRSSRREAEPESIVSEATTAPAMTTTVEEPLRMEELPTQAAMPEPATPQSGVPVLPEFHARSGEMHLHQPVPEPEPTLEDLWASSLVEARELLPSKLIEFPRELVSPKRARPRLPEAPEAAADTSQLRIFEVQPDASAEAEPRAEATEEMASATVADSTERVAGEPSASRRADVAADEDGDAERETALRQAMRKPEAPAARQTAAPPAARGTASAAGMASTASSARAFKDLEWVAISLDRPTTTARRPVETKVADAVPFLVDPAGIDRRLMAFAVDFSAVTAGFFAFLLVFAASTPHLPTGITAAVLAGTVYLALWVLYQVLFFSLSGATAGMVYARIALCTFNEQNPTRAALRKRLAAWWLSCLPLGLGFFWCFVDEDNLSWHDRITRTYQREY